MKIENHLSVNTDGHTLSANYRADIDGLRAVAVMSVLFFHTGFDSLSGGFAGVDVFFVISGFLITSILLSQASTGRISIREFYIRRAKRILPALIVICLSVFLVGYFQTTPLLMKEIGFSLAATMAFAANFYFKDNVGYFDLPAHEQPLLHTWSLAVEEQYYIFWPLFLVALLTWVKPNRHLFVLVVLFVGSLVLSEWQTIDKPTRAFYLLPGRLWELLLGGIIAIEASNRPISERLAIILTSIGMGMVIFAMFWLDETKRFPGLNALVPCLGTAFIIYGGMYSNGLVTKLLSLRIFVGIGLISYSLYLWHWPVIVFYRYFYGAELAPLEVIGIIAVSFILAILSWRFVEQPIRRLNFQQFSGKRVLGTSAISIIALAGIGLATHLQDGWPHRVSATVLSLEKDAATEPPLRDACHGQTWQSTQDSQCDFGVSKTKDSYDIVIFGDSHADHFTPTITKLAEEQGWSGRQISRNSCLPLIGVTHVFNDRVGYCEGFTQSFDKFIKQNMELKLIVLAGRWAVYTLGKPLSQADRSVVYLTDQHSAELSAENSQRVLTASLERTAKQYVHGGADVLILGQVPPFPSTPNNCLARKVWKGGALEQCDQNAEQVHDRLRFSDRLIADLAGRLEKVYHRNPSDFLCLNGSCAASINRRPLYLDDDHINSIGARELYKLMRLSDLWPQQ